MLDEPQGFLNIAHRGASAYARENTAAAFEEAIARNADMIELDLRQTSDGVIVLHHDPDVPTPDGKGRPISHMSFAELTGLAEADGQGPATFADILAQFGDRIAMNIEIKNGGFEREVVRMLKADPPAFEPVISSFKPEIIKRIKKMDRSIKVGLIVGSKNLDVLSLLARPFIKKLFSGLEYDNFHLHKSLVSQDVLDGFSDAGYSVYVWTVNDPEEMRRMLRLGVTGIISDVPDIVYETCLSMSDRLDPVLERRGNGSYRFMYAVGRLGAV